jgi:hypothetical protein
VAEISPPSSSATSTTAASSSSSFYYIRADRAQFPLQKLIPGKEHSEQIAHQLQQLLPQQQQLMEQTMLRQQQQQQLFLSQNQQNALGHVMPQKQYHNELCHLQSQSSTLPSITENCMAYVSASPPDMTKSQTFYFAEDFLLSQKENSAYIQFLPESQSPLTSSQLSFPVSVLAPASNRQPEAISLPAQASSQHSFPVSLPVSASSHHSFPVSLPAPAASSHHPPACTQIQYVPCYFYYPVPVPYPAATAAASSAILLPPALAAAFSLEQNDGSELSSSSSAVQGYVL